MSRTALRTTSRLRPSNHASSSLQAPGQRRAGHRVSGPLGVAIATLALHAPAIAQEGEERPLSLESLQTQLDELREAQASMPTTGGPRSSIRLFGRLHLDAWNSAESDAGANVFETGSVDEDPQNNIEWRRARIGVAGDISTNMLYKIELEFGHPDGFAYKDMFLGWKDLPVAQTVRLGNQKRPYGLDHLNSSRYNVFLERPFSIEAFNQDARRLGLVSYGTTEELDWSWLYGIYNMRDWSQDGEYVGDTLQPELAGRIAHTAWYEEGGANYGHWALSGTLAKPNGDPVSGDAANEGRFRTRPEARTQSRWIDTGRIDDIDSYVLAGAEGVVNVGPTQVVAELQNSWVERDGGDDLQFWGGYLYVSHFLTGEHIPWSRRSGTLGRVKPRHNAGEGGSGAWQVAARYSVADFSDEDILGGEGEALTLGLNWHWNPNARLQFNYIKGTISERAVADTAATGIFDEGDYEFIGFRFMVDF